MLGQLSLSLVPSEHNGFNVSCFGFKDGSIDLTASGGAAPYTYTWSTGTSAEDLSDLPSGFYSVRVVDANQVEGRAEITLTEPDAMKADVQPYEYGNGYNISLYNAYNGSINLAVYGGVAPFTYDWSDGATSEDRNALGSDNYSVTITDANGCVLKTDPVYLRQPERSDWTMSGNSGTNPATHFFGTTDNQDVVFKSNGQERLRLLGDGSIKLLGSLGTGPLYRDPNGILRAGGPLNLDPAPVEPCALTLGDFPYWETDGNTFQYPQCDPGIAPILGSRSPHPIKFITDDQERMILTVEGKLGLGTEPPPGPVNQYRLFVEDGIVTRDVLAKAGPWPDYVFKEGYHLLSFDELRGFIRGHGHLPGMLSAAEVETKGGIELADSHTRLVKVVEEQALYILQLEERFKLLEQRVIELGSTSR